MTKLKFVLTKEASYKAAMNMNSVFRYCSLLCVGLLMGNTVAFVLGARAIMDQESVLYGGAVGALILTLAHLRKSWRSLEFIAILFALICIVDEWVISRSSQIPFDQSVWGWSAKGFPTEWLELKSQWVSLMYWRCALLVTSFFLLLFAPYFKNKTLPSANDVVVV